MAQTVPLPTALRSLIESNNQLLKMYQSDLTKQVMQANEEMMRMLNLNPNEGWRLDLDSLMYVKVENTDATSVSE
jgi:hypothetical protein